MNLAVIPARGGSKRIPGKNIRPFCGRPIIEYSIEAAQASKVFDRIIVSTDCPEIADIAKNCGVEVPFVRPGELACDHTPTIPVIAHAIEWFASNGKQVEFACCIYATAPFVLPSDIKDGHEQIAADPAADFLLPITTFAFPIFRALKMNHNRVTMIWPENELVRSQELPEACHDAGQFYWGTKAAWTSRSGIYSSNSIGLKIPRHRVQDIDTLEDWAKAEMMYKFLQDSVS